MGDGFGKLFAMDNYGKNVKLNRFGFVAKVTRTVIYKLINNHAFPNGGFLILYILIILILAFQQLHVGRGKCDV